MSPKTTRKQANREYSQLLRMQERLLSQLLRVRDELVAPVTEGMLREIRNRTGSAPTEAVGEVISEVEEAIRALKLLESEVNAELLAEPGEEFTVDGVSNLPAPLGRFLAERSQYPGFKYDVVQDEVRGWVIRWKEYTHRGTVRGYGQFYERPYAWLDE
jgi:hypothetical protein